MINSNLKIKLIDFQFASQTKNSSETITKYCGTPLYYSPEIFAKKPYNGKAYKDSRRMFGAWELCFLR
jgi:serine/threonine protein kinase